MSILSWREPQYRMSGPFLRTWPQEAIRALLMASQRCSPADGWDGLTVFSQGCTLCSVRLFILVCGQQECPDEHLSSPLISMADMAFSGPPDWMLESCPVPIFCLLWPADTERLISILFGLQVFESAGVKIGNCPTANREKQGFILLLSS